MKVSVPFSFLRHARGSHFWTHPRAQYVVLAKVVPFGVRKMKFEI